MEANHPIILAKDFRISDILLRHIHREVGGRGGGRMVAATIC